MTTQEALKSEARARKASAQARWRARRRGEDVPKLKPGPRPAVRAEELPVIRFEGGEEAVDV